MKLTEMPDLELIGHGPHRVVCLHGWFGPGNSWSAMREWADADSFTYAVFPCRGYGSRRAEPGDHTIAGVARDAVVLADELGWPAFSVAGHSMGGKAAQLLCATRPKRVRRVVAIAPVPATGASFDDATAAVFRGARDDAGVRRAIIDRSTGGVLVAEVLDRMTARSLEDSSVEAFAGYLESWAFDDFGSLMPDTPHELLVLLGGLDPDINGDEMARTVLRWFPHASVRTLPGSGHYPLLEQPEIAMRAVQAFLAPEPGSNNG